MFDVGRESSIELSSSVLALPFPARFYAFQSRCMSRVHLSKPWLLQMSTLALNFKAPSMPWPAWTCECHGQCPGGVQNPNKLFCVAGFHQDFHVKQRLIFSKTILGQCAI